MTPPTNSIDSLPEAMAPPPPKMLEGSPEARAQLRGQGALCLAVLGLFLELTPAFIFSVGGRGRFAFTMMGLAGGLIAGAAVIRAFKVESRTAQWAEILGVAGVIFMLYHAPVCVAIARFLAAVWRAF